MRLFVVGLLEGALFVSPVLAVDLSVDLGLVVLLEPFSLLFVGLLEEDVLLTRHVHILQQVDTSLVLTTPLLLSCVPLFIVFFPSQLFKHPLLGCLVRFDILVVLLEFLDLMAASQSLLSLVVLNGFLALECSTE